jgi:hypothetical protein
MKVSPIVKRLITMIAAWASTGSVSHCGGVRPKTVSPFWPPSCSTWLIGPYSGLRSHSHSSPYAISGTAVGSAAAVRAVPTTAIRRWSSSARPSAMSRRAGTAKSAKTAELVNAVRKMRSSRRSSRLRSPIHSGARMRSYSVNASPSVTAAGSSTSPTSPTTYGASISASWRRSPGARCVLTGR